MSEAKEAVLTVVVLIQRVVTAAGTAAERAVQAYIITLEVAHLMVVAAAVEPRTLPRVISVRLLAALTLLQITLICS